MTGLMVALIAFVIFLGVYHPKSGSQVLDWKPTRSPELEAQNEIDDLEQMLEAANARRRARGDEELTEETLQRRIDADKKEAFERSRRYKEAEAEDLQQMLSSLNARRRRRGEPELTEDEYRAKLEADAAELKPGG
jgi:hypothetical protein